MIDLAVGPEAAMVVNLANGGTALIDPADRELILGYRWLRWNAGTGYAAANVGKKVVLMHRLILAAPKGLKVDHRNGDGFDNRRANIRLCTHAENMRNCKPNRGTRSRFKGVWFAKDRRRPWRADIQFEGRSISLGSFMTEEEAAAAHNAAALKYHGEFARLNDLTS